jgi:hypothetical protein
MVPLRRFLNAARAVSGQRAVRWSRPERLTSSQGIAAHATDRVRNGVGVCRTASRRSRPPTRACPPATPTRLGRAHGPCLDLPARIVTHGHDLQPARRARQDPPRGGARSARGTTRRHASPIRPLEQGLPLEVEPTRRRPDRRPASRLGPGIEPQLERPVLVGRRVGPEEDPSASTASPPRPSTAPTARDPGRDPLERRRQHVVHRVEVVVDEPDDVPIRPRRRGRWSTPGPSRTATSSARRRSPRVAGRATSVSRAAAVGPYCASVQ